MSKQQVVVMESTAAQIVLACLQSLEVRVELDLPLDSAVQIRQLGRLHTHTYVVVRCLGGFTRSWKGTKTPRMARTLCHVLHVAWAVRVLSPLINTD